MLFKMRWLEQLNEFLLEHHHQLHAIESGLRTLTYVLPGRFEDAEFVSELCMHNIQVHAYYYTNMHKVYACLNLTGFYHDTLLSRKLALAATPESPLAPAAYNPLTGSPFNRYTRHMLNRDPVYRRLAYLLTLLQYTEVFMELAVRKRWTPQARWRFVFTLELVKGVVRLVLLKKAGGRMLLAAAVPERDHDPAGDGTAGGRLQSPSSSWRDMRTGRPLAEQQQQQDTLAADAVAQVLADSSDGDVTQYLMAKALSSTKRRPMDLLKTLSVEQLFGELLYILRPIIYSWLLLRQGNRKTWAPWMVSLVVDLASRALLRQTVSKLGSRPGQPSGGHHSSPPTALEADELRRRSWLLLFYLLRNPCFEVYTKQKLVSMCNSLLRIPIFSIVGGIVKEYIPLWEHVYFYTSAS